MPINKNAQIRYMVLDRCFRNPGRRYDIYNLVEECNEALKDIDTNSSGIRKRQIYYDIKFMQDSLGFDAPIITIKEGRRSFYRYEDISFSINNNSFLNVKEAQQLRESLLTLSKFKGLPQFDWIEELMLRLEHGFHLNTSQKFVSFDENLYLKGIEYIGSIYNSLVNGHKLVIEYKSFNNDFTNKFKFNPYHLKQYNNRWFLVGTQDGFDRISILALDRIVYTNEIGEKIHTNSIDFDELFEDIIGVSLPSYGEQLEKVVIKIKMNQWNYIKSKPIHGSQKIIEEVKDYAIIQIELYINFELQAILLSYGEDIEIVKPIWFRELMLKRIQMMLQNY